MNKVDFKRAYELYKEKYKSDYGWKIYMTYKIGRVENALLEYEDPKYPYKMKIVVDKNSVYSIPFFGCYSRFLWIDDFDNVIDAIVYLMIIMTIQISIFTILKNGKEILFKNKEYELPKELKQIESEEWEKLSNTR